MKNNSKSNNFENSVIEFINDFTKTSNCSLKNTKFILETFAKEHDYRIQKNLYKELLTKYSSLTKELENKIQEITIMSVTDQLTGLFNRRKVLDESSNYLNLYHRYNSKFSVILLDVDNFKKVNDTYGHDVGDKVLKNLAKIMRNNIRTTDILGRWGGEEFIIVLPETNLVHCVKTAEKLRKSIENINLQSIPRITCSFGAAECIQEDTIDSLLKRVDQMLYQAKHNGKNRVEFE